MPRGLVITGLAILAWVPFLALAALVLAVL